MAWVGGGLRGDWPSRGDLRCSTQLLTGKPPALYAADDTLSLSALRTENKSTPNYVYHDLKPLRSYNGGLIRQVPSKQKR